MNKFKKKLISNGISVGVIATMFTLFNIGFFMLIFTVLLSSVAMAGTELFIEASDEPKQLGSGW